MTLLKHLGKYRQGNRLHHGEDICEFIHIVIFLGLLPVPLVSKVEVKIEVAAIGQHLVIPPPARISF
jgi:hypothetical protein